MICPDMLISRTIKYIIKRLFIKLGCWIFIVNALCFDFCDNRIVQCDQKSDSRVAYSFMPPFT